MARLRCARCGEDWVPGFDRCWNCGFDGATLVPDAANRACANCQTPLLPGDQFCPECGEPAHPQPDLFRPIYPLDEPTNRRRRFGLWQIGLILVAAAVLAASVYTVRPDSNRNPTIIGTLTLFQTALIKEGDFCVGHGEYDDLAPGERVTIRNEDDETIAVGRLDRSTWLGPEACRFSFTIPDVPRASVYRVEVADRDRVEYTRRELEEANWRIFMFSGDPARI
jgi:hypothetical protein